MSTGVLRFGTISVFRELSGNDNGAQGISAGKKMDLDFFLWISHFRTVLYATRTLPRSQRSTPEEKPEIVAVVRSSKYVKIS